MKIKRFLEKDEFDDYKYKPVGEEEEDDDIVILPKKKEEDDISEEEFDESASDIDTLCYYVRQLFTKSGVDVTVDSEEGDIRVYVFLERRENMFALLEPFKIVEKLQNDLLIQYDAEVELYENKKGFPIIAFSFSLSDADSDIDDEDIEEGDSDEKLPF